MSTGTATPAKRRGRPAARWLSLEEVAEVLRWEPEALARVLDRAPGVLPGAECGPDGWTVPERALRVLLGEPTGPLPATARIAEVAAWLRCSVAEVYRWTKQADPGGRPLLPVIEVMGLPAVVRVSDLLKLPAVKPEWMARRAPFSFSQEEDTAA